MERAKGRIPGPGLLGPHAPQRLFALKTEHYKRQALLAFFPPSLSLWDSPDKVLKGLKPPSEILKGLLTACVETTAISAHTPTPCNEALFPQQAEELLHVFLYQDLFTS